MLVSAGGAVAFSSSAYFMLTSLTTVNISSSIDFLNSVLKLNDEEKITKIEYLPEQQFEDNEIIRKKFKKGRTRSETANTKNQTMESIDVETNKRNPRVDVHCMDSQDREYLIEMQVRRARTSYIFLCQKCGISS